MVQQGALTGKVLVSGGTGFIGSAVVEELLRRGESVAVLGRDERKIRQRFGDRVEARPADVRKEEQLRAAMEGIATVVNAVQFPNSPIENPRRGWTFEEVDYIGTINQVDAAKAADVRRFLYVSGVGAAPTVDQHWFRYKWLAEQHLLLSDIPEKVIIRPTWVYGPNDNSLNRILRFGKFLPFIPLFGDGEQPMQPVYIDDLARIIADAATKPEAANQLFEVGGPQVMSMNEVIGTALDVMGKKRRILHLPAVAGKLAGRVLSLLPGPPLTADAVEFILQPATADNLNLARVLHPKFTLLRDGLSTYLGSRATNGR